MTLVVVVALGLLLAGLVVPLIASVERRRAALQREGVARPGPLQLRPERPALAYAAALDGLLQPALGSPLRGVAALILALAAWALIPFGGRYEIAGRDLSLVVADLDHGLLWLLALAGLATCASLLQAARADGELDAAALLDAARELSQRAALGVALLGVLIAFGTLRPAGIGLAQQESFRLLGLVEQLGWAAPGSAWIDALRLPSWGVFVQPAAFALGVVALLAGSRRSLPGTGAAAAAGDPLVRWLESGAIAALVTLLFLGGWSLPWLPDRELLGALGGATGPGAAALIALPLHVAVFALKLVIAVVGLEALRARLAHLDRGRLLRLAWRVLLPLALLNALVSAVLVAPGGTGA